jgi:hypothetical protein
MADQEPLHKRLNYDKLGIDKKQDAKKRVPPDADIVRPKLSEADVGEDATFVIKQLNKPEGLLSGAWLQGMSDQELVFTVIALILELQGRVGKPEGESEKEPDGETTNIGTGAMPYSFSLERPDLKIDIENFVRLPAPLSTDQVAETGTPWRFILISSNPKHELLRLEVHDDIVIGRSGEGVAPNLDLTFHDGVAAGISRRHAVLRPTPDHLLLIDQESTNGTFHNRKRLAPGKEQKLEDQDIISFSNLHFKIMFVSRPGD